MKTRSRRHKLRRISHPASPTYKEGPSGRANGHTTHNAYKEIYQGPHVSMPEKDKDERRSGGAGRPPGSAEPGRPPVQVHFEEDVGGECFRNGRTLPQ